MNPNTLEIALSSNLASHVYVVLAFILAILLSKKTEKPGYAAVIIFWVLSQPVLNAYYIIKIPGLPFDLQPNRLLFFFLMAYFSFNILGTNKIKAYGRQNKPDFLPYLIAYVVFVFIAMAVNYNTLTFKRLIAIPLEPLTYLLLLLFIRDIITEKLLKSFLYAIIIMAVVNALVALYQITVDIFFLRTGIPRIAFSGIYRSYGVFPTEYILGSLQVITIFIVATLVKKNVIKYSVISLLAVSLVTTFHRLDLLIAMVCGLIYVSKYAKKRMSGPILMVLALGVSSTIPAYVVYKSIAGESKLVSERLSDDTVSGRFQQFAIVIKNIPRHPLGLGSYDHPIYQKLMIENNMTKSVIMPDGKQQAVGLGVHNGFLGAGIQYGILAMFAFTMLLWKMFNYFRKRASREFSLTIIPLFAVGVWVLSNLSNGVIVFSSYNVMLIALLVGAFVGLFEKGIYQKGANNTELSEDEPLSEDGEPNTKYESVRLK